MSIYTHIKHKASIYDLCAIKKLSMSCSNLVSNVYIEFNYKFLYDYGFFSVLFSVLCNANLGIQSFMTKAKKKRSRNERYEYYIILLNL